MEDTKTLSSEFSEEYALDIRNLTVEFDLDGEVIHAVNGISLSVKNGKTLGLVGETGAGKTTTAKACLRLTPTPPGVIRSGEIYVCGKDVLKLSGKELRKVRGSEISMIFQDPMTSLDPVFTVEEQIAESFLEHEKISKEEAIKKAGDMLELVGIPCERGAEYPHQFSGGMRQRVVIAIALSCSPKVLIADEPTTALDVTIQAQVLELMRDLKQKYGMAMVLITHDLGIVAEVCDEVAVMYAGKIVEKGTLEEIFEHTKHPYTEGLFDSLPNVNSKGNDLKPIPGLMPDPAALPEGCAFAPRCKYATEQCRLSEPALHQFSDTHTVACCAYNNSDFHIERKEKWYE